MTRILSLLLFIFLSVSCKVQYASFQESTGPKYNSGLKKKLQPKTYSEAQQKPVTLPTKEVTFPKKLSFEKKVIPILISPEPHDRKVYNFGPNIKSINLSREKENSVTIATVAKKKKGKKFRQVSSNLFLGILFLVIAGVLGYLNLLSLAILFALASIIFLILAVKQLWKRRGKNKKKEKRKDFFKDLFS